jgi:signal transduction histidine kinase
MNEVYSNWKARLEELYINSKAIAIGWFNSNGILIHANPSMYHFLGTNEEEKEPKHQLINPNFDKIKSLTGEDELVFEGLLTIGDYKTTSYVLSAHIYHRDDSYLIYAEADVIQLFNDNSQLSKLNREVSNLQRMLIKEKTKLEHAMNELQLANQKLNNLNIEKNKYIGIVAHDLRNPLGNAYGFADILINDYEELSKEEREEYLNIIKGRCSYSIDLIENFLDASKIESGIMDLNFKEWSFCETIKGCIDQNLLFARKKKQVIHYHCACKELLVLMDKDKVEQVINNFISNAIKYSKPEKSIWIEIFVKDEILYTQVRDEGLGIAEEEKDLVFKPFATTSNQATQGEKSTGLGLAICKKIIEAHSGEISFESTLGVGSTFTFTIPL